MSNWFEVANIADLPNGGWHEVDVENTSILIINMNGQIYAIENLCTHDGGTLADGHIEGENIVCPRHGAKFCIKTGAVTAPPAYEDIKTFPTRLENGKVLLEID
jgi:3-phenylpropionate/trans-cinnamate dioxygenase ferredoxin subunit